MSGAHTAGTAAISDQAMLVVIGALAIVMALVWLWGGLAGLLFGGGWPHLTAGQLAQVPLRLPAHVTAPAAAWPAAARPLLPDPLLLYATIAALLAMVAMVGAALARLRTPRSVWRHGRAARAGLSARICASCVHAAVRPAGQRAGRVSETAGWHSAATVRARCMPSADTRWSRSDRRSQASRPGWRSQHCSNGKDRRSPPRSRPTCWVPRWRGGRRSGRR